jgi:hypothetical protein
MKEAWENLTSVALHGHRYRGHIIHLENPARALAVKGPTSSHNWRAKWKGSPWQDSQVPLGITLSTDIENADDRGIDRLLRLSRLEDVSVDVCPGWELVEKDHPSVGVISWGPQNQPTWVCITRESDTTRAMDVPEGWRTMEDPIFGREARSQQDSYGLFLELAAHLSLGNDLFVTSRNTALSTRLDCA